MATDVKTEHIGETNTALNGQKMTIIDWVGFSNITIKFEDDTVVKGKRYDHFKSGYIVNPNCPMKLPSPKNRVGQTNRANNGLMMTIIVYRNATDLDVRFENGEIVKHKSYKDFLTGTIGCQGYGRFTEIMSRYAGIEVKATNGQMMKVVGGTSYDNLTVQFDDGTEVTGVRSSAFYKGTVTNPNFTCYDRVKESFVGMTARAKNGLMMTIIAFRDCFDVDIRFEDGVEVYHKKLQHFKQGSIKHPNINASIRTNHLGEKRLAICGLNMEIVGYNTVTDSTIRFETGFETHNKVYYNFMRGRIGHPFPYQLGDITIEKLAYIHAGVGNFYCRCNKCKHPDIMCVQEMREHICQKM